MNCFLFDGLLEIEKQKVEKLLPPSQKFTQGSELYKKDRLAVIVLGKATVYRKGEVCEKIPVREISAGEVFGAASLFGEWQEGLSSVVATINCEIVYLSQLDLVDIMHVFPTVSINYIKFLSDRIRFLNKRIDFFSADTTVSALLEFLTSNCDESRECTLNISMSELSKRIGIGRSSLYRALEALEISGKIKRDKKTIQLL